MTVKQSKEWWSEVGLGDYHDEDIALKWQVREEAVAHERRRRHITAKRRNNPTDEFEWDEVNWDDTNAHIARLTGFSPKTVATRRARHEEPEHVRLLTSAMECEDVDGNPALSGIYRKKIFAVVKALRQELDANRK